ncbi:hypothetical protein Ancab_007421 [Ancistrocladus abbreviatus]
MTEEISADGIFKNYEHGGSKRTFVGSNYDPSSEVSQPSPKDEFDQSMQHSRCSDDFNNNQEHSLLSPIRSYKECLDDSLTSNSQSKHEAGCGLSSRRSCGDMRSSHKLFLACSNRPSNDDDPRLLRSSGREMGNGKRSLGFSNAEGSNDVTSSPRTRDVEAFERSNRVEGSSGPPSQHMGLPTIPPKGCIRMKIGNPHKKDHNVVRLDKVLNRMRICSLKAQLKFKKRRLGSRKKTMPKSLPPLNSSDFSKENPQGSLGLEDSEKKNLSLIGEGVAGDSLSNGNIVNMNRIIIHNHDKLGTAEIWDISKQLGLSYPGDDAKIIQRIQILEDQDKNTTAQNVVP